MSKQSCMTSTPSPWLRGCVGQHRARGLTLALTQGGTTKDSAFTSFYFRDTVTNVPTSNGKLVTQNLMGD
jgi:hypothetical protein